MQHVWRGMFREMATALAVLALYVLILLLPLHQAAGLQRDLNAIGYSTLSAWSLCQPQTVGDGDAPVDAAALTCPVTGIAKQHFTPILPAAPDFAPPAGSESIGLAAAFDRLSPRLPAHKGQPRAPPVTA